MANSFTTNLNLTKPEVGAATDAWGGLLNTDLDTIDAIFANGTGTAVGLNTVGKNLNVTAGNTAFKDGTDATKIAKFSAANISTGTTRTYTLPDTSDTLVTLAATQALSNKSLTAGTTYIKDGTDATKVAQFNAASITTATTRTYTLPDASGTVTLIDATQTLTNKTIDTAGTNTIKVNGNTLAASAGTATVTLPNSTTTLVGRDTTDTLTNKTISGGTLNNAVIGGTTPAAGTFTTVTDATGTLRPVVQGTAVATTSGTSVTFTGLPSWIKKIHVLLTGVSNDGTDLLVQLGTSGGIVSTGYVGTSATAISGTATDALSSTAGFPVYVGGGGDVLSGKITIMNIDGNTWVASGAGKRTTSAVFISGGNVSLAAALTQIRLTSTNGTAVFDAGSVNIVYE